VKRGGCLFAMKRKQIRWMIFCLAVWLLFAPGVIQALGEAGDVELRIRLRDSEGAAVVGETVILARFPEEEAVAPTCLTDASGECAWSVGRGLYQVLFTRPLDNISALSLAEGGLRGFGVTVGDTAVTYHFTFHSDGRVYFDAAPESAVPVPVIPSPESLHGGVTTAADEPATEGPATPVVTGATGANNTPTARPSDVQVTAVNGTPGNAWRVILLIGLGLLIGAGLHLWSRRRQPDSSIQNPKSTPAGRGQNQEGGDA
jgi:hypothetical protein